MLPHSYFALVLSVAGICLCHLAQKLLTLTRVSSVQHCSDYELRSVLSYQHLCVIQLRYKVCLWLSLHMESYLSMHRTWIRLFIYSN